MKLDDLIKELQSIRKGTGNVEIVAAVGGDQRSEMQFKVVTAEGLDDLSKIVLFLEDDEEEVE